MSQQSSFCFQYSDVLFALVFGEFSPLGDKKTNPMQL
jgi:hypothetical protein